MIDTAKLKRKVARWRDMASQLEQKYKGNEQDYTYHAGYSLGYLHGQISAIENLLDIVEEGWDEN